MSKQNVLLITIIALVATPLLFAFDIVFDFPFYIGIIGIDFWLMSVVGNDAKKRNKSPVFSYLALFLGFIGGFIYYALIISEKD